MRLNMSASSSLAADSEREIRRMATSIKRAVSGATAGLRQALQEETKRGFSDAPDGGGQRLARTWRSQVFPSDGSASVNAAGFVWTRAPVILDKFDKGGAVASGAGFWLAVPLPAAGKLPGNRRWTVAEWERRHGRLRYVYRRGGWPLLVSSDVRLDGKGRARRGVSTSRKTGSSYTRLRGRQSVPIFVLVPRVMLKRKVSLDALADAALADLAQRVDGALSA